MPLRLTVVRVLLVNDTSPVCHWGRTATSPVLEAGITRRGHEQRATPASAASRLGRLQTMTDDFDRPVVVALSCEKVPEILAAIDVTDRVLINAEGR